MWPFPRPPSEPAKPAVVFEADADGYTARLVLPPGGSARDLGRLMESLADWNPKLARLLAAVGEKFGDGRLADSVDHLWGVAGHARESGPAVGPRAVRL
jgi:hypothetical protein